jgi:hypothetical protein
VWCLIAEFLRAWREKLFKKISICGDHAPRPSARFIKDKINKNHEMIFIYFISFLLLGGDAGLTAGF